MNKTVLTLLFLISLFPGAARAQQQLEIIDLKSRTAEQVLPQLRPFIEPGGTLSGMNNKIFIRASATNRQQIRELLSTMDQPPRRLLISVRQDAGSVGAAGGQVIDSRSASVRSVSQQVQVVEGGRAYINVGVSVPVPLRQVVVGPGAAVVSESLVYRDLGSGFTAEPQLAGNNVTLTISPTHDTPGGAGPGSVSVQRLTTTVSGRLGEWIDLGGSVEEHSGEVVGTSHYSTRSSSAGRRVQLKVDELP